LIISLLPRSSPECQPKGWASFCASSRLLAGSQLGDLVEQLLGELLTEPLPLNATVKGCLNKFVGKVPFLSALGSEWPLCVKGIGGCFANMNRCQTSLSIDLSTTCVPAASIDGLRVTREQKNWRKPLPVNELAAVLAKTPLDSDIHICVISELQQSYVLPRRSPKAKYWSAKVDVKGKGLHAAMADVLKQFKVIVLHKLDHAIIMSQFSNWNCPRQTGAEWKRSGQLLETCTCKHLILILEAGPISLGSAFCC
jgi:hypothetical protein